VLTDDDKIIKQTVYATMKVTVFTGVGQALSPTASGSVGTAILSVAATDPAMTEALSLVSHEELTWARIYDIIEFLGGGERSIEKSDFAPSRETGRVRQTANYYPHLGNPKDFLLPSNPPTLNEASLFAKGLLRKWIATRI
jgi:hypothetical protein